jgi:hypothetical protein
MRRVNAVAPTNGTSCAIDGTRDLGSTRRLRQLVAGLIAFAAAGFLFVNTPISRDDITYRTAAIKTVAFIADEPSYPHASPSPRPQCKPWMRWC